MNRGGAIVRLSRAAVFVLAAWLSFFGLQAVMSMSISPRGAAARVALVEIDFAIALLWAGLSFGIDAWHRAVRARTNSALRLLALHIVPLVVSTLIDCWVARWVIELVTHQPSGMSFMGTVVYYADFDLVSYLAVVAVSEALLMRRAALARQQFASRLEASLDRARLDYLEAQLQPHFLFNSLGAVSELAYDAPASANRVLQQLIAIFRRAQATKSDEITLGEELLGIEPYLDIQRIRFADWLTIEYAIDDAAVDCVLPRFVLQPLVENAIRHGLSGRSAAGVIEISAVVANGSLVVRVTDNGVGLEKASRSGGRGIGLANVGDRLSILYGDDNRLRLIGNATGGAIAELTIPVRRRAASMTTEARAAESTGVESELPVLQVPAWLRRPGAAIGLTWLLVGLLWTQQSFIYDMIRNRLGVRPWYDVIATDMTSALIWALLTPIVLAAVKRYPIRRSGGLRIGLGYLVAGMATTLVHVATLQRLTAADTKLWSLTWQPTFAVGFVIFLILAAIGHRGAFLEWLRSREAAAASLSVELAEAQRRAEALQAIPNVLLQALDGVAATVRVDASLSERQLSRLADYLRLALECSDARGITTERQQALDAALGALCELGAYSPALTRSA